jgi:pimeloyl-ACP methyl ester carboxylesterase
MGEWISAVLKAVLQDLGGDAVTDGPANGAAERVVLLGHSMGGVVVQGALAEMGAPTPRVEAVLLDSPVVGPGQSAVDVSSEVPPAQLPPRDTWIEPTPLASGGELNDDLVAWANDRLCATPFGPQIDPLPTNVDASLERCHLIFFADTPAAFPAPVSRRRCESKGVPFTVAPGGHDQPLADSAAVAGVVLNLLEASS